MKKRLLNFPMFIKIENIHVKLFMIRFYDALYLLTGITSYLNITFI